MLDITTLHTRTLLQAHYYHNITVCRIYICEMTSLQLPLHWHVPEASQGKTHKRYTKALKLMFQD